MRVQLPCLLQPLRPKSPDLLTWTTVEVAGRRAEYCHGGSDGPPVVFLHGWGLGSHAYQQAIRRLLSRGCRVYAPSLPSFGRTASLPWTERNLDGYGAWVASFIEAVGIDEPALVIGHSFGGGVGIKLAQRRPDLVSYLVLLNAIGSVAPRSLLSWWWGFAAEAWPLTQAIDMARAVSSDLVPNLTRNPVGLMYAALIAISADLRDEAAALKCPVLVLTSERDSVIPRNAFDALCAAIGSEGRVVSGHHAWMLADPDSFDTALASLVDVQVSAHRSSSAAGRGGEIVEILAQTRMPKRTALSMVRDAHPLWLMSESPPVLAADLALCHPKLKPGEVRAVARPIEGSSAMRLTVVAHDRPGLLADSAAVLASQRLSITHASAATWPDLALHSLVVHGGKKLDAAAWDRLGQALRGADTLALATKPVQPVEVTLHGEGGNQVMLTVKTRDRLGVLAAICRVLADMDANIESLQARTSEGMATDTFLLAGAVDVDAVRAALSY